MSYFRPIQEDYFTYDIRDHVDFVDEKMREHERNWKALVSHNFTGTPLPEGWTSPIKSRFCTPSPVAPKERPK